MRLTKHAIQRYRERIRDCGSDDEAEKELRACMVAAKPKHIKPHKRTSIVPLGCCMLVCERGAIVTVLARDVEAP
jgi:hypothetical protein